MITKRHDHRRKAVLKLSALHHLLLGLRLTGAITE